MPSLIIGGFDREVILKKNNMKEFKGTKGEWKVSKDMNDEERVVIEDESNSNFIDCWSLNFCTEDEMRANAKLIAAAPELLEAVQYLVSVWDEVQGNWRKKPDHVQQKFLKAIDKALN